MSEEEKKAIEYIKEFRNEVFEGVGNKSIMAKNIDILLNLIEKLQNEIKHQREQRKFWRDNYYEKQKEIEDLKEKNRHLEIDKSQLKAYMETCCIKKSKIEKNIYELKEKAEDVKQKYKGVYAYKDDYLEALAKIEGYEELLEDK